MNNKRMFLCIVCITVSICQAAFSEADSTDFVTRLNSYTSKNRKILDIYWTDKCDEYSAADYQHAFESHIGEHGLLYQTKKAMNRGMFEISTEETRPMIQEAICNSLISFLKKHLHPDNLDYDLFSDDSSSYRSEVIEPLSDIYSIFSNSNNIVHDSIIKQYRDIYLALVESRYDLFSREHRLDPIAYPRIGNLRWNLHQTIIGIELQHGLLSKKRRRELCEILGLPQRYRPLFVNHAIWMFDNNFFNELTLQGLCNFYSVLPNHLKSFNRINSTWAYYDKDSQSKMGIFNALYGFNTFLTQMGKNSGKQFPTGDWTQYPSDFAGGTFNHETAHQFNRVVEKNLRLQARHRQIKAQASATDDLDYLRSNVGAVFLKAHGQEFIASIANQWFASTTHTLGLALHRFDKGYVEPLHQFLFYADMMSNDSDSTFFYINDHTFDDGIGKNKQCLSVNYHVTNPRLIRDEEHRITAFIYEDTLYSFDLNESGNVLSYSKEYQQTDLESVLSFKEHNLEASYNNNRLNISVSKPDRYTISIFNARGQQLSKVKSFLIHQQESLSLDNLNLSTGIYYTHITNTNGTISKTVSFLK